MPDRSPNDPLTVQAKPEAPLQPGITGWIDSRFPVIRGFTEHFLRYPMPRTLNGLWTIGAMLTAVLALMLATGLVLAMNYTPTADGAFASIEVIDRRLPSGWLLRGMHVTGASLFLAALYAHLLRGLYYGSYKQPREMIWLFGVVLLAMVMATSFAGYVLPWGQMSYWGADVVGKAISATPLIGPGLEHLFLGGEHPGDATLHHLFVLHFALAFAIVGVVALHVAALHVTGPSDPRGITPSPAEKLPFHPYFTVKDGLGLVIFALIFATVMFLFPNLISEAENYRPANPLRTPTNIEPEWYFLPFYGILQSVPSKFGGLLASAGALLVLFFVPWLDRSPTAPSRYRALYRLSLSLMVIAFILVGLAGKNHVRGIWLTIGELATAYYYLHFLAVMPLLARAERHALERA